MANSLDPDQAQHNVWPDLGQNRLQKLSADDTSRQRAQSNHKLCKRNNRQENNKQTVIEGDRKKNISKNKILIFIILHQIMLFYQTLS